MDINVLANWCSIISVVGLGITIWQIIIMKSKTETCLNLLRAEKDFEMNYPLLENCQSKSNDNLKKVSDILCEVHRLETAPNSVTDEICELIKLNDDLKVEIEEYISECQEELIEANKWLRNSLENNGLRKTHLEYAKAHMEACHEKISKRMLSIRENKEKIMAHAFGKD